MSAIAAVSQRMSRMKVLTYRDSLGFFCEANWESFIATLIIHTFFSQVDVQ